MRKVKLIRKLKEMLNIAENKLVYYLLKGDKWNINHYKSDIEAIKRELYNINKIIA